MIPDFHIIKRRFLDGKDITIYPIADIHLGAMEHKEAAWREFRTKLLSEENSYVVLGGDLINNGIKSSVSSVYDETIRPREQKKLMVEMLSPMKDKILCAVSGNHERRSSKEVDDDIIYDVMCKLDIEERYRENIAFLKIQFGTPRANGSKNPTYILAVTHGSGSGVLTGSAVNKGEKFGYVLDGVDALIIGHSHKAFATIPAKLKVDPQHDKVLLRPFKVVSCSSWLDYGGYAVQKNLLPAMHVDEKLILCANEKKMGVEIW